MSGLGSQNGFVVGSSSPTPKVHEAEVFLTCEGNESACGCAESSNIRLRADGRTPVFYSPGISVRRILEECLQG
jgi:hypothetical protein